jgi:hypothetical protein
MTLLLLALVFVSVESSSDRQQQQHHSTSTMDHLVVGHATTPTATPTNWTIWSAVLGFQVAENFRNVFSTPFDINAVIDGMRGKSTNLCRSTPHSFVCS